MNSTYVIPVMNMCFDTDNIQFGSCKSNGCITSQKILIFSTIRSTRSKGVYYLCQNISLKLRENIISIGNRQGSAQIARTH